MRDPGTSDKLLHLRGSKETDSSIGLNYTVNGAILGNDQAIGGGPRGEWVKPW